MVVKLNIYEIKSDKTYVDSFEAKDFDEFIIVTYDSEMDHTDVLNMHNELTEASEKKIIMVPDTGEFHLYGVKEDVRDRSTSS